MRLLGELAAGLVACAITYYLARPSVGPQGAAPAVSHTADHRNERPQSGRIADGGPPAQPVTVARNEQPDRAPSPEQERAMTMLRNAAIAESSRDMQSRGQSVVACVGDAQPAGTEKLRFAVEVTSTPTEATLGAWRFIEVADGEPVPPSFAECAARALGGGQHLVPPAGFRFPDYRGELSFLYTIDPPPGE